MSTPKIHIHEYIGGHVAIRFVDHINYFAVDKTRPLLLGALSELDALAQTVEPDDLKDREPCERKGE